METDTLPEPVFLGFCARSVAWDKWSAGWREPGGWASHVTEICSASDCFAERPPDWVDGWDFNRASCWNDETAAWTRVPEEARSRFHLFAYFALPLEFDGEAEPLRLAPDELFCDTLPSLPALGDLSDYERIGYDVVEYVGALNYGCSPLSCNGMGERFPVNRYCLLDSLTAAYETATVFGREEPEPGPFLIMEIWRRTRRKDEG